MSQDGITKLRPLAGPNLTAMLIMLGMIGPFAFQIFLPSMPGLAAEYGVSTAAMQTTVSLYLVTFACAQLCLGPLADRFGRRRVITAGLTAYMAGALICATAQSIEMLAAGRAVQAIGGCAGLMFARVIARDLHERGRAAGVIGFVTMMTALAGSLTPILGGWIDVTLGWQVSFWCTLALGVVVFTVTLLWLPETRPEGAEGQIFATFRDGFRQLRSPAFLGYAGHGACTLSAWYAMISGLPYVMVDVLEQPTIAYGLYFPFLSLGYMAGNLVTARVAHRWDIHRLIVLGVGLALLACPLMLAWNLLADPTPLSLFLPMGLISFGHGMSQPGATSGAIGLQPRLAGSAAGLMGFGQWLIAALTAQAVGVLQNETIWPTTVIVVVFTVLSYLSYLLARRAEADEADTMTGSGSQVIEKKTRRRERHERR